MQSIQFFTLITLISNIQFLFYQLIPFPTYIKFSIAILQVSIKFLIAWLRWTCFTLIHLKNIIYLLVNVRYNSKVPRSLHLTRKLTSAWMDARRLPGFMEMFTIWQALIIINIFHLSKFIQTFQAESSHSIFIIY
jgi:hypothetical protein